MTRFAVTVVSRTYVFPSMRDLPYNASHIPER